MRDRVPCPRLVPPALCAVFVACRVLHRRLALIRGRSHPTRFASGTWLAAHGATWLAAHSAIASGPSLGLAGGRYEFERQAIVAPALAGGRRPVVKNMSLMPAAARAVILRPRQYELEVLFGREMTRNAGKKARPARAALEFHLRGKQRQRTTCADEYTGPLFAVQRTRERTFGGLLAQHRKLGLEKR